MLFASVPAVSFFSFRFYFVFFPLPFRLITLFAASCTWQRCFLRNHDTVAAPASLPPLLRSRGSTASSKRDGRERAGVKAKANAEAVSATAAAASECLITRCDKRRAARSYRGVVSDALTAMMFQARPTRPDFQKLLRPFLGARRATCVPLTTVFLFLSFAYYTSLFVLAPRGSATTLHEDADIAVVHVGTES